MFTIVSPSGFCTIPETSFFLQESQSCNAVHSQVEGNWHLSNTNLVLRRFTYNISEQLCNVGLAVSILIM